MGKVEARYTGFCPRQQPGRQGFPGVCHRYQYFSWRSFSDRAPVVDKIRMGFLGDSERPHHSGPGHAPRFSNYAS